MNENKSVLSQALDVYQYMLDNGSITSKQANDELGITRLAAVILQLKKAGVKFEWKDEKGIDRRGRKTWWRVYSLA